MVTDIKTYWDHTNLSNIGTNTHSQIDTHIASTSNPHSVDASDVGLGSVYNADVRNTWTMNAGQGINFVDANTRLYESSDDLYLDADDDIYINPDDDLRIQINGTQYAHFDGEVQGLYLGGSSTPSYRLQVNGGIYGTGISGQKISGGTIKNNTLVSKYTSSNHYSGNSLYAYSISCHTFKGPGGTGGEGISEETANARFLWSGVTLNALSSQHLSGGILKTNNIYFPCAPVAYGSSRIYAGGNGNDLYIDSDDQLCLRPDGVLVLSVGATQYAIFENQSFRIGSVSTPNYRLQVSAGGLYAPGVSSQRISSQRISSNNILAKNYLYATTISCQTFYGYVPAAAGMDEATANARYIWSGVVLNTISSQNISGGTIKGSYISSNGYSGNNIYGYTISCAVFKGPVTGGDGMDESTANARFVWSGVTLNAISSQNISGGSIKTSKIKLINTELGFYDGDILALKIDKNTPNTSIYGMDTSGKDLWIFSNTLDQSALINLNGSGTVDIYTRNGFRFYDVKNGDATQKIDIDFQIDTPRIMGGLNNTDSLQIGANFGPNSWDAPTIYLNGTNQILSISGNNVIVPTILSRSGISTQKISSNKISGTNATFYNKLWGATISCQTLHAYLPGAAGMSEETANARFVWSGVKLNAISSQHISSNRIYTTQIILNTVTSPGQSSIYGNSDDVYIESDDTLYLRPDNNIQIAYGTSYWALFDGSEKSLHIGSANPPSYRLQVTEGGIYAPGISSQKISGGTIYSKNYYGRPSISSQISGTQLITRLYPKKPDAGEHMGEIVRISGGADEKTWVFLSVKNDANTAEWIQLGIST